MPAHDFRPILDYAFPIGIGIDRGALDQANRASA